ncbi:MULTISPECIES: hypothetical protein [unclassified Burkholderia]|uniref:hypothetical protein n=1 Tax=unclassified Burkholderia TaxID=2613784 RepID=UPI001420520E|nr:MULTISPECIES: hypothetical protein [unclassified Burkholderia]NIE88793.1 hypothetical protein [Burkholderia sp. Tr-860]NIF68015.1 hypothetical protein [Burkholderia sp. Cy-647]NIF98438.1 hypothetical protein [Burkholderia sp. Ax-1720]
MDPDWFPAKTHGWGWGAPATWQGWLVLLAYVVLMSGAAFVYPPKRGQGRFLLAVLVLSAVFLAVVWATGETPRWRA